MFSISVLLDVPKPEICPNPAHLLSAQIALVSIFFQMFIVLGMYNFPSVAKRMREMDKKWTLNLRYATIN